LNLQTDCPTELIEGRQLEDLQAIAVLVDSPAAAVAVAAVVAVVAVAADTAAAAAADTAAAAADTAAPAAAGCRMRTEPAVREELE